MQARNTSGRKAGRFVTLMMATVGGNDRATCKRKRV